MSTNGGNWLLVGEQTSSATNKRDGSFSMRSSHKTSNSSQSTNDVGNMLQAVCVAAMSNMWSKAPHLYQTNGITLLLSMYCKDIKPSSMLLIQGTGSGKSTVPQTVGVVTCGVTMILENTLSLGADQQSKLRHANQDHGPIHAFQLDSLKTKSEINSLKDLLLSLPNNTNASIFVFT